ncbi:programmed cell death 1 ligand 1 isoform X8 [Danio rerio]|uniref:Programmed cell death 1 ligand 1 isoform X8 n=1 Tax=Danio rerio TaxID=7955 RepID=A0AC58IBZ4_DANRE
MQIVLVGVNQEVIQCLFIVVHDIRRSADLRAEKLIAAQLSGRHGGFVCVYRLVCCVCMQGSMKRTLVIIFQALLWPAVLSASFTVNVPRSTYEAELNGDVRLECVFSALKRSSDITVIWSRVHPKPDVNIYWLDKGKEIHNHTSSAFHKRAQLISHLLRENRAVLHLKKLRIKDSGTYQCIVEGDEVDYKQITLNVTAPFSPVRKSLRKAGEDEVELSLSSTDEDLILIVSKLKVERELVNNYTCTFIVKGEIQQTATFSIPDDKSTRRGFLRFCVPEITDTSKPLT